MENNNPKVDQITHLIEHDQPVVVLTGAGISTPSGIPDFRSERNGLWMKDDPMQVASLSVFQHDPQKFYNWLRPLVAKMQTAQPNPAHFALAQMEKMGLVSSIITQNIDGLHQRAGSSEVIELHGSAASMKCLRCGNKYLTVDFISPFLEKNQIPTCPICHSILKPDIVLYEELLPVEAWEKAERQCKTTGLLLVIGSSLEVSPANQLPWITLQTGGRLIIINLSPTLLDSYAEVHLSENASGALASISNDLFKNV